MEQYTKMEPGDSKATSLVLVVVVVIVWWSSNSASHLVAKQVLNQGVVDPLSLSLVQTLSVAICAKVTGRLAWSESTVKVMDPDTLVLAGALTATFTWATNLSFTGIGVFATQVVKCAEVLITAALMFIMRPSRDDVRLGFLGWICLAVVAVGLFTMTKPIAESSDQSGNNNPLFLAISILCALASGSRNVVAKVYTKASFMIGLPQWNRLFIQKIAPEPRNELENLYNMFALASIILLITGLVSGIFQGTFYLTTLRCILTSPEHSGYQLEFSALMMAIYNICSWFVLNLTDPVYHSVLKSCKRATLMISTRVVVYVSGSGDFNPTLFANVGGAMVLLATAVFAHEQKKQKQIETSSKDVSGNNFSRGKIISIMLYTIVVVLLVLCGAKNVLECSNMIGSTQDNHQLGNYIVASPNSKGVESLEDRVKENTELLKNLTSENIRFNNKIEMLEGLLNANDIATTALVKELENLDGQDSIVQDSRNSTG